MGLETKHLQTGIGGARNQDLLHCRLSYADFDFILDINPSLQNNVKTLVNLRNFMLEIFTFQRMTIAVLIFQLQLK